MDFQELSLQVQKGKVKMVKELVQQAINEGIPAQEILEKGLLAHMISPRRARFVTHLDVDREDVERAAAIILEVLSA